MQIFQLPKTFHRRDLIALVHRRETQTRIHTAPINVHGARTALAMIASLFRSCQIQVLSQAIEKSGARIDPQIIFLAVYTKRDWDRILGFC
jgi:hypothetical protein